MEFPHALPVIWVETKDEAHRLINLVGSLNYDGKRLHAVGFYAEAQKGLKKALEAMKNLELKLASLTKKGIEDEE